MSLKINQGEPFIALNPLTREYTFLRCSSIEKDVATGGYRYGAEVPMISPTHYMGDPAEVRCFFTEDTIYTPEEWKEMQKTGFEEGEGCINQMVDYLTDFHGPFTATQIAKYLYDLHYRKVDAPGVVFVEGEAYVVTPSMMDRIRHLLS